jgi:cholesterol oxidase
MQRLASPIAQLRGHYPVVVVGSGYGGGITASRLARAGQAVCVLERGREIHPGEYPNTLGAATAEFQVDTTLGTVGSRTGLFDLRVNPDLNVLLGCGLGGTSLINANVGLRPDPRVFDDPRWPAALRADLDHGVNAGYGRAEAMLRPTPYPDDFPPLPKLAALAESARALGQPFYRPPIYVTFQDGLNPAGVEQKACVLCGDCVSGCNYGAKNTVLMNYLPDAKAHGAEIFTGVSVRHLAREDDHWVIHYQVLTTGQEPLDAPTHTLTADLVVLAAGALGSTELLLRSQAQGLPLSDQVGQRFSGNGDFLGFSYNGAQPINATGFGALAPGQIPPVGPNIAGIIDLRDQPQLRDGFVIEDSAAPGAVGGTLAGIYAAGAAADGQNTVGDLVGRLAQDERAADSLLRGPYQGAVLHTQIFLVMAHDSAAGRLVLAGDRLRVQWPGVGDQPIFSRIAQQLLEATRPLQGIFVPNPFWKDLAGHNLTTVHPLGGCAMAETAEQGVVNHRGQVFAGAAGDQVYPDLYVSDGAIVPTALGVNPSLTISALAERAVALLAQDRGWVVA